MRKTSFIIALVAGLVLVASGAAAALPNKCVINGTVTYQQDPCPSDQVRKSPTVQALNAEEKRQRAAAGTSSPR